LIHLKELTNDELEI